MAMASTGRIQGITLNLLRIVAGLLFMQHGAQKLFGLLGGRQVENLASLIGVAGVLEFFGGLLIVLGLFTAPVAFILAGEMAVAYFRAHAPRDLIPIQNGGELSALYAFIFLFLAAHGGGRFSLDGLRLAKREAAVPETDEDRAVTANAR